MHKSGAPNFGEALATGRALDLKLPDTTAVIDAYAQAHAESQPWLFNHVVRSWLYGAKLAQYRALKPDGERAEIRTPDPWSWFGSFCRECVIH